MKRFFVAVSFILALGATGVKADNESGTIDNPKQIPDSITISANRNATPLSQIASTVTIISEKEIEASQAVMVSDLLRSVPGLDVVQTGGMGRQTSVFLRGANSNHTLVIIDGVEMNSPSSPTTSFDFAHLNIDNIERIEILRGSQSVLYGSEAIGGVINVFTKRGFGKLQAELKSEIGSYNTFSESAQISGNSNKIDYSIYLSRKDSDGFSAVCEDAGGIEKDGYENTEFSGRVGIQLDNNYEMTFIGRSIDATADIDQSFGILDDPNYVSQSKINSFAFGITSHSTNKCFNPKFDFNVQKQELASIDLVDTAHGVNSSTFNADGKKIKTSLLNQFLLHENSKLLFGVEFEVESFSSDYFSNGFFGPYGDTIAEVDAQTFGLFLLEEAQLNDNWSLTAGLRYDNHEDFGDVITYRFSSAFTLPNSKLKIKANIGSGFKAPSLFQLNHEYYGNPDLQPEESVGWEFGFENTTKNNQISFGALYFSNQFKELIGYDLAFCSINIAKASSEGVELYGQLNFNNSSARIDYTYSKTKDKTTDAPILRRPEHKVNLNFDQSITDALKTKLQILSVSKRNDTDFRPYPYEDVVLEAYKLINISASYNVMNNLTLTGRVHNLFDEDYEEVLTYNTAGRSLYGGIKVSLQ